MEYHQPLARIRLDSRWRRRTAGSREKQQSDGSNAACTSCSRINCDLHDAVRARRSAIRESTAVLMARAQQARRKRRRSRQRRRSWKRRGGGGGVLSTGWHKVADTYLLLIQLVRARHLLWLWYRSGGSAGCYAKSACGLRIEKSGIEAPSTGCACTTSHRLQTSGPTPLLTCCWHAESTAHRVDGPPNNQGICGLVELHEVSHNDCRSDSGEYSRRQARAS